ncbi:MAG TPA: hypothetical protein EYG30_13815 [Planctomycetes bacterium]|nr:hypothetical protein [Planctomycetota bacterium]HIL53319.1 hypothetical protein [Planctomycetota bacterium]
MKHILAPLGLGSFLLLSGSALAQTGPDLTVLKIANSGTDIAEYGQSGGIYAYSFATTSCNPGTQVVQWTNADHPVISQNFFRLKDGRFEHIGQSWLKHGFCAVNEAGCGTCQSTSCDTLGLGCADTYGSGLNDGKFGGPKYAVNALTGAHTHSFPSPSGNATTRGRLQVAAADIEPAQNPGAVWFAESQYISAHEAMAGNGKNSVSYRRLNVSSATSITSNGGTVVGKAAPHAWRSVDPAVVVNDVNNPNEGGAGVHGHFSVGYRVTDLGGGIWRYNYVVENLTSEQACGSWSVPMADGLAITNLYFNDVDYHSGETQDGTDWVTQQAGGMFTWSVAPGSDNAIRWSTTYSFGFDVTASPIAAQAQIGLHQVGSGSLVLVDVRAPSGNSTTTGTIFCKGDGTGTSCPCNNHGGTNNGCQNSTGLGAGLTAMGDASVSADTLQLTVTNALASQPGLLFQGSTAINGGNGIAFGDGLRCTGGNVRRLEVVFPDSAGSVSSSVILSVAGLASAGDVVRYQLWYRDPVFSPCVNGFNLTNGLEINWLP